MVLRGSGTQVVPLTLPATGIAVFKLEYQGAANFIVHLLDQSGAQQGDSLANVIDKWTGTIARNVQAGSYHLAVESSGAWTVTVWNMSNWPNGGSINAPLTGQGTNIVPITLGAGLATVSLQYTGQENFIVHLLADDGEQVGGSLANEIGAWNGTVALHVDTPGNYIVAVDSSGPWSIMISQ